MALFNHVIREANAKIVYFGPGCSGKESSITHIYRKLIPDFRSSIKALALQGNRMLFYDFCPADNMVEGYVVRFHLYTVVGEVLSPSTWKMALKGVDGLVFVADSDPSRQQENLDALDELQGLLVSQGSGIDQIPLVMQYNRRDIPDAVALDELQRTLNRDNVPGFPTVAATGEGVNFPLSCLTRMVLANIREKLEVQAQAEIKAEEEVKVEEIPEPSVEIEAAAEEQIEAEVEAEAAAEFPPMVDAGEAVEPEATAEAEVEVKEETEEEEQPEPEAPFWSEAEEENQVEVEEAVAPESTAEEQALAEVAPEAPYWSEAGAEPERREEVVPAELVPLVGKEINLELSGRGELDGGRLTIPVTVTTGIERREFLLIISLDAVVPPEE